MIIYKTINLKNGKIYIGQDKNNNPKYLGSGKILNEAFKKYGKENFKKEILEYCNDPDHLNMQEIFWINKLDARKRGIGYNIASGGVYGDVITNNPNRELICKKISIANKGKKRTDKQRKNLSKSLIGHSQSLETRRKISETRKLRKIKPSQKNIEITIKRLKNNININAKTFYLYSPAGKEYIIHGALPTFCKENNLNLNVIRQQMNKGIIKKSNRIDTIERNNTDGWESRTTKR